MYEPIMHGTQPLNIEYGLDENSNAVRVTYPVTTDSTAWVTVDEEGAHPAFGGTGMSDEEIQPYIEHARDLYTFYHDDYCYPPGPEQQREDDVDDIPFEAVDEGGATANEPSGGPEQNDVFSAPYTRTLQRGPDSPGALSLLLGHNLNVAEEQREPIWLHYNQHAQNGSTRAARGTILVGARQMPIVDALFAQLLAHGHHVFALNASLSDHRMLPRCGEHHRLSRITRHYDRFIEVVRRNCQDNVPAIPPIGVYAILNDPDSLTSILPLEPDGPLNQKALSVIVVEDHDELMLYPDLYELVLSNDDRLNPAIIIGGDDQLTGLASYGVVGDGQFDRSSRLSIEHPIPSAGASDGQETPLLSGPTGDLGDLRF